MEKIKLGHIGTRHDHSRAKLEGAKKFPDLFEIVGIVPESPEVAEKIKNDKVYGDVPVMTEEELATFDSLVNGEECDDPFASAYMAHEIQLKNVDK